jgi:hypothetical protein
VTVCRGWICSVVAEASCCTMKNEQARKRQKRTVDSGRPVGRTHRESAPEREPLERAAFSCAGGKMETCTKVNVF